MKLSGNKLLITGATAGIGKALLEAFVALDNEVIALGRNEKALQKLAAQSSKIIPYACDLAATGALDDLVLFIEQQHPDLNILINNAGIQYNYNFLEEPHLLPKIELETKVNFLIPLQLSALLLPILQTNSNAAIVNVSSGLGLVPKQSAPVYCATKAGIHIFSKAFRDQLETVKVFEIIPPLVSTQMTAGRGKGKISPEALVKEFLQAFKRNQYEIAIGKTKLLRWINRLSPALADRIMRGA